MCVTSHHWAATSDSQLYRHPPNFVGITLMPCLVHRFCLLYCSTACLLLAKSACCCTFSQHSRSCQQTSSFQWGMQASMAAGCVDYVQVQSHEVRLPHHNADELNVAQGVPQGQISVTHDKSSFKSSCNAMPWQMPQAPSKVAGIGSSISKTSAQRPYWT